MLMQNWSHFWMGGFWVFPVLMIGLMFVCIFLCARIFLPGNGRLPFCGRRQWEEHGESTLEIAKRRYAAGEITGKEFEDIKRSIS